MALANFTSSSRSNLLKPLAPVLSFAETLRRPISTSTDPLIIETSVPFTFHNCEPPSRSVETNPQELISFFRGMATMRRMEIAADSLYKAKLIRGFCHLYDGQEAVAVGMEAAITKKDCIITAYRDHCTFVGARWDPSGGLRGTHGTPGWVFEREWVNAFLQEGGRILWRTRDRRSSDGMGTAEWRAAKNPAYYKRGDYVPGLKVDGMDALAVKQACKFAKEHVLRKGPIILEMDTYRYHGHSMSDPGSTYRTRDEISGVRQERDPVERIRKVILAHDLATEKELKDFEKEIRKEVDQAIAQAKESPMPEPYELFTNVYVKGLGTEAFGADRKEVRAVLP
ncbi:hypothetical protein GH714_036391 [Hevea brasiliensis]|uniref:Dehydrogenase E1 component domain-containing protein n=1 Tax=Hevea brasiliensis TaxID=3981 RepID=A0A6A6LQB5_HEVBR|nr:hypothetical protein GH714_036391 [Hevea brasiliensis]